MKQKIIVVGTALDDKGGAFVRSTAVLNDKGEAVAFPGKGSMFFVDGLDEWGDRYYGKEVEVTGKKLRLEKYNTTNPGPDSISVAQFFGTRATLLKPKWKLVN